MATLPEPCPGEPYDAYLSRIVCLAADVWRNSRWRRTHTASEKGQGGHVIDYVGRQLGLFDWGGSTAVAALAPAAGEAAGDGDR